MAQAMERDTRYSLSMNTSQRMNKTINKLIFETIFREELCDETINVLHMENNTDLMKGTNFLSDFFKMHIIYSALSKDNGKMSEYAMDIIVKSEPMKGISLDMVRNQNLFMTELTMLKEVVPMIEELVGSQIGPKLWHGSTNLKILVMEDLSKRGFVMKDRQEGLSMEHCLLAIKRLAKLHAGSVALHEKYPGLVESFKNGGILSANCPKTFMRLLEESLKNVSKAIQHWSNQKYPQIASKLNKLARTFIDRCADIYKYDSDEFCVLNHGDCWINNLMFREDENCKPCDVVMVDYQMTVYSSPAIDLHFFLNTCPHMKLKYEQDEYFLNVYLETLTSTLASIGCITKVPTIENLKAAMYRRRIYAVYAGVILHLRMMADEKDIEDFEEVLDKLEGKTKMDVFKNPKAVTLAHKMIPIMDQRGYFD